MDRRILAWVVALAGVPATAGAEVLFEDRFDTPVASFSGTGGWEGHYCDDPWTTQDVPGLTPQKSDVCKCGFGGTCDYGMAVDYQGVCQSSDPLDNVMVAGDSEWTDYQVDARFSTADDDTVGIVFRYWNSGAYYVVQFSRDQAPEPYSGCPTKFSGSRLVKVTSDTYTGQTRGYVLAQSKTTYDKGVVHAVRIVADKSHLVVRFGPATADGLPPAAVLFDVVDTEFVQGKVGFFAYGTGLGDEACKKDGCWFDDLVVSTLGWEPEANPVADVPPEPEPEPPPEWLPETPPESSIEPEPEPVPESVDEPSPEPIPEAVAEAADEPVPEPAAEPSPEAVPEAAPEALPDIGRDAAEVLDPGAATDLPPAGGEVPTVRVPSTGGGSCAGGGPAPSVLLPVLAALAALALHRRRLSGR